ncbi:hypothetical protein DJ030_16860 [bacterium endosymbiont of Escarpia laminata]|nr:MAG: hypothetical protein DJ030_16860 [bacterium endosymbiont of Escarpia laminata]
MAELENGKIKLVYLLAASHSGSTLTAMLLNSHPDTHTTGELKVTALGDIDRYRCSCQALIKECPFWNKVNKRMADKGYQFEIARAGTDFRGIGSSYVKRLLRPLFRGGMLEFVRDTALMLNPTWRRDYPKVLKRNEDLIHSVAEVSGKRVIVDSSKIGLRLKFIKRIESIDLKVVRVNRDGRAVALTYMDPAGFADATNPELRGGGMGGDRREDMVSMQEAARRWLRSNEEADAIAASLSTDQLVQIKYEDLCADPDKVLDEVFTFIGVDPDKRVKNFRSVEHHVIGNGMRLDDRSEISLDERWKERLTEEDLRIFSGIAGEKNRALGYS